MNKKFILRTIIILTLIFLLYIFFSHYFSKKNNSNPSIKITENKKTVGPSEGNIIKGIRYFSESKNGDTYLIFSDYGEISLENPDITYMTNVTAIIVLKNSEKIQIKSDFANFNHKSYETEFIDKVIITRRDEKINSEKLEFSLEKNLVVLSEDVILNKPGFNLKADKIEIDLITKNSTITMNNKEKKVTLVGTGK